MDNTIGSNDMSQKTNSLCWECARACGGANCPWADSLKPVRGWILAPDTKAQTQGVTVLYCPMFFKGRNLDCMTPEQIQSCYTNTNPKMSRLHIEILKNKERTPGTGKRFICPICENKYASKVSSCTNPECGVKFLYDVSTSHNVNYANLRLRSQFLMDYKDDFPNSKINDNGGE